MREQMPGFSVRKLCRLLQVNRQWYYHHRCLSAHQEYDQRLRAAIQELREAFVGYGYRRVTKALVRAGWKVNHKRVWGSCGVMRQAGLTCRRKRRTVHTTDSKHSYQIYPNLVKGLQVEAPNRGSGGGPDLCAAARGFCVPGLSAGRVFTQVHRLEPVSAHRCATASSSAGDGLGSTTRPSWVDPSFRQRQTVL
jgi:hypothetical protein